jgi:hypothetical protein
MSLGLDKLGLIQVDQITDTVSVSNGSTHTYLGVSSKDVLYDKASQTFYMLLNKTKPDVAPLCIVISAPTESWLFQFYHTAIACTLYLRKLEGRAPYWLRVYDDENIYKQGWIHCRKHSS